MFPKDRGGLDQDGLEDPDAFFESVMNTDSRKSLSDVTNAIRHRHLSESSSFRQHLHSRQSLHKQCIIAERNKCRSQHDEYNSTVVKVYSRLQCFDENEPVSEIDLSSVSTNTDSVLLTDDIEQEEQCISPVGGESELEQQDVFFNITDENNLTVTYHEDVSSISEGSQRGSVETKENGSAQQESEATKERRLSMVTTDSTRHHKQSEILINTSDAITDTTKKHEHSPENQLAISYDNEITGLHVDVSCNASYSHTPLRMEASPASITKEESISSSSPSVSRLSKTRQNKHRDLSERNNRKKRREKFSRISTGGLSSNSKHKSKKGKLRPNRFATVFTSQGIPQPRTFTVTPVVELQTNTSTIGSASNKNLRRSSRVRIKPLEYWKGDCVEYGPNDFGEGYTGVTNMSIPLYIRKANPTPFKPRKVRPNLSPNVSKAIGITKNRTRDSEPTPLAQQFDATKLRKKYEYIDGNAASIWNDAKAESMDMKVICRSKSMKYKDLPKLKTRTKSEGSTSGKAAQAFYVSYDCNPVYPGYIMGKLVLPAKGMKDAECVGSCAQTFTILTGQPNSIEVAFADPDENASKSNLRNAQRFLLDPGDVFRIPPGNSYQLQNHSKTHECTMSWTIIRPTHPEDMEDA